MKSIMAGIGFILWLGLCGWFLNTYSPDRPWWWSLPAIGALLLAAYAWHKRR
jgi:hypothetical protein